MKIELNDEEAKAFLLTKEMLISASTPVPQFLNWVADRLVYQHGDNEHMDFIQALRRHANSLRDISQYLDIRTH